MSTFEPKIHEVIIHRPRNTEAFVAKLNDHYGGDTFDSMVKLNNKMSQDMAERLKIPTSKVRVFGSDNSKMKFEICFHIGYFHIELVSDETLAQLREFVDLRASTTSMINLHRSIRIGYAVVREKLKEYVRRDPLLNNRGTKYAIPSIEVEEGVLQDIKLVGTSKYGHLVLVTYNKVYSMYNIKWQMLAGPYERRHAKLMQKEEAWNGDPYTGYAGREW